MNKFYVLVVFCVTIFSCGDSSLPSNKAKTNPIKPYVSSNTETVKPLSHKDKIIAEKLDDLFTQQYKSGLFNGSVLVAKADRVLFKKSFGLQNKSSRFFLTDSSMFQLASVSKIMTSTAILLLHERNLIDLNKNFNFYFPDFPYANISIKNLLCHRSGLANYIYVLNKELYLPDYKMSNLDMYNFFVSKKPEPYLKPDKRFNYCNTNYALLALLIEKITKNTFSDFLQKEFFKPLGMKHTATINEIDLNGKNITKPYDGRWRSIDFDASDYVLGDKSIYSTPYDMYLFSKALYENKLINSESQALAYTAYSKERKVNNYGFGWRIKNFKDSLKKEVYHNGWWHGYRSSFHRRLRDTLTVVIFSNQLNYSAYHTNKVYEIIDNEIITDTAEELE
jgi:CubicO group peptidase (beta-lactamase class C family)